MPLFGKRLLLTAALVLATGSNLAVAGSIHTSTFRPTHGIVHHAYSNGSASHRGFFDNFFHALLGIDYQDNATPSYETEVSTAYTERVVVYPRINIPTEAERYQLAFGKALPASHGVIVLPPSTPNGDITYIWPTSED